MCALSLSCTSSLIRCLLKTVTSLCLHICSEYESKYYLQFHAYFSGFIMLNKRWCYLWFINEWLVFFFGWCNMISCRKNKATDSLHLGDIWVLLMQLLIYNSKYGLCLHSNKIVLLTLSLFFRSMGQKFSSMSKYYEVEL